MAVKDMTRWRSVGVNSAGDPMYVLATSGAHVAADYSSLTRDELIEELQKRGLAKSGNKNELIARLREADSK